MKVALLLLFLLAAPIVHAASSERIVPLSLPNESEDEGDGDSRATECRKATLDQYFIARMISQGRDTFEHLRERANNSKEQLGDEHYARIMQLLDEAEKAHANGDLRDWYGAYWKACYDAI